MTEKTILYPKSKLIGRSSGIIRTLIWVNNRITETCLHSEFQTAAPHPTHHLLFVNTIDKSLIVNNLILMKINSLSFKRKPGETIPLEIHPTDIGSDTAIINFPGRTGAISGYNEKHAVRAEFFKGETGASVVRTVGPHDVDGESYHEASVNHVEATITYVLQNAVELFGQKIQNLILVGHSNGGFGIIENAHKFKEVSQLVLTAPAGKEGKDQVIKALARFTGNLALITGSEDPECSPEQLIEFRIAAHKAQTKSTVIDGGDHDFRGSENGKRFAAVLNYALDQENHPLDVHAEKAPELY